MMTTPLVMLIDDSEMDLFVNEKTIQFAGITERFVICKSGILALNYLKNNTDSSECLPDFIFLDLNMPVMNGTAFMKHYEELPDHIKEKSKIIILSSSNDNRDKESCMQNKYVIDYLVKPLSEEALSLLKAG